MTETPKPTLPTSLQPRDDSLLANVALLYYQEGLNQGEIAKRIGVSRATIINYLRESRERGIVDIRVQGEALSVSKESRELCRLYNLEDAYIADTGLEEDPKLTLRQTARTAASAIHNILEPGDKIGVAWGETVKLLADYLPHREIPTSQVCQVIGSMDTDRLPAAETCAIQIAKRLGAVCHTLHAPAVLSSAQLAQSLRMEPAIKIQLDRLDTLDAIITSVGDLGESTHLVTSGIIGLEDLAQIKSAGGAGFICSCFVDKQGNYISFPLENRMIAIGLEGIRRTPKRIVVASGHNKANAVQAVIQGGFVTHAVLSKSLAQELLRRKTR